MKLLNLFLLFNFFFCRLFKVVEEFLLLHCEHRISVDTKNTNSQAKSWKKKRKKSMRMTQSYEFRGITGDDVVLAGSLELQYTLEVLFFDYFNEIDFSLL